MFIGRTSDNKPTSADAHTAADVKPKAATEWQHAVNVAKGSPTTSGWNTVSFRNSEIGTDKIKNTQGRLVGEVTVDHSENTVTVTAFNPATGKPLQVMDPETLEPTNKSDTFAEVGGRIVPSGLIKATYEPPGTVDQPGSVERVSLTKNVTVHVVDSLFGDDNKGNGTGLGAEVWTPRKNATSLSSTLRPFMGNDSLDLAVDFSGDTAGRMSALYEGTPLFVNGVVRKGAIKDSVAPPAKAKPAKAIGWLYRLGHGLKSLGHGLKSIVLWRD